MEYLFLNNEKILNQIKEKISSDKLDERCARDKCYIDYSKVYFFVNLDPGKLGIIYTMVPVRKKINQSIAFQIYAGVKINKINSIYQFLDFLTMNHNNDDINFVIFHLFIGLRVFDIFFFNPGDIINKVSKIIQLHENDRIFSTYSGQFFYDMLLFTIDSYQNGQLFRKTYKLLYQNGELYLLESYPSFFQYTWNRVINMFTKKNTKCILYIKLHNE